MQPIRGAALIVCATLAACAHGAPSTRAPAPAPAPKSQRLEVEVLGAWNTGVFDGGAAEIVAHDATRQRLYVVNRRDRAIDVLDLSEPATLRKISALAVGSYGGGPTSVAVSADRVVVTVEAANPQTPGRLVVFAHDGAALGDVQVGALPDMVALTPDGRTAVVANEGEPSPDYTDDPVGSISLVDLATLEVRTVALTGPAVDAAASALHRPAPPSTSLERDLEPEYVAISPDSSTAWVTLQEASALAVIDLRTGGLTRVAPLGARDMRDAPFDASDRDGGVHREPWPVRLLYQPDAAAAFEHEGEVFVATANEGDARDYPGYSEEARVADLQLDAAAFPDAAALQAPERLGRLKVSRARGDTDGDGDYDELYGFGARSFAIWTADGAPVWDSGAAFEELLARLDPDRFNSQGTPSSRDSRSDDKGVEPEGIAVGSIDGRRYAFVGLERAGGFFAWDITDPRHPTFAVYAHSVDPSGDVRAGTAGDISPEGMVFIPASQSPIGVALLAIAHEVSGSTRVYALRHVATEARP